jgi:hypothetical protein
MKIEVKKVQDQAYWAKKGDLVNRVSLTDEQSKVVYSDEVIVDKKEFLKLLEFGAEKGITFTSSISNCVGEKSDALIVFAKIMGEGTHECNLFRIEEDWEKRTKWLKVIGIITIVMIALEIIGEVILAASANSL